MTLNVAARACALVGTRFRPQGRCAEGLDCVGLVLAACGLPADAVRRNYRLSGDHLGELESELRKHLEPVRSADSHAGDVLLLRLAHERYHLAVRTNAGFVHAHAGIGRVVETPGEPDGLLIGTYRMRSA
jgi:hypothetical protein